MARITHRPNRWAWSHQPTGERLPQDNTVIAPQTTLVELTSRGMDAESLPGERNRGSARPAVLLSQDPQPLSALLLTTTPPAAACQELAALAEGTLTARPPTDATRQTSHTTPAGPVQRLEPSKPSDPHEAAVSTQALLCHALAPEATLSPATSQATLSATPILDLSLTFQLSSRPGASKVIYLDFNGHTTTGTAWNDATMGSSFYSPAYSFDGDRSVFSDAELTRIQQIWQRVANDFSPFDINVTTLEPPTDWLSKSSSTDQNYGIRAVITNYGPYSTSAGGIAFVDSFTASTDTPVYIYNSTIPATSEAISHEVGHSLGLAHDGNSITSATYYTGHGTGETSWAPIMGSSYNRNVTSWDDGSYTGSNNSGSAANYGKGADDLAVITSNNGVSYQLDLAGNSQVTASTLSISGGSVNQFGTIETRSDSDWYSFRLLDTGNISLNFDPYWTQAYVDADGVWGGSSSAYLFPTSEIDLSSGYPDNATSLDLAVDLYNDQGSLLYKADSPGLATSINVQGLTAGAYYLKLDGVGFGDPTASTPTGYSDYASIGNYMISGTITSAADSTPAPVITLSLSPASVSEDGSANLVYTFTRSLPTDNPLTVNFTVSGTATNGSDYSGLGAGSNQSVSFAANAATATVVVDPTADTTVEADETVSLLLSPGTGYSIGSTSAVTGSINNDDLTPVALVFTAKTDILTGTVGADSFGLNRLSDALWSSTPDRITNLQAGLDTIDSPINRSTAIKPKQLGMVQTLDAFGIESLLTSRNLPKNGAATFSFNDASGVRSFLAINDATAGFKAGVDSVIEITGYTGNLSMLSIF